MRKEMSSNEEAMKDPLEIIGKIKPVETPPFLYTRIMQQIEQASQHVSRPVAWSLGGASIALCIFSLIISLKAQPDDQAADLGTGLDLVPQNSLYND